MNLVVTGSGGATRIPNATCSCPVCAEARVRGIPYKRLGQSLYCRDLFALFDTPEDINEAINARGINRIDSIFFTHWHPDHTAGLRVIEALHYAAPERKVDVYLPPGGLDFAINGNSILAWFAGQGYCALHDFASPIGIHGITVTPVTLENGYVNAFALDSCGKRIVHAPCHSRYLPDDPVLRGADVLIAGMGKPGGAGEGRTSFDDTLRIMQTLKPRRMILTHIEERWRVGHDELVDYVSRYPGLEIAYDGMELSI